MKKLTYTLSVLGLTVVTFVAGLIWIIPFDGNSYLAAAKEKQQLLVSVKSPRIILVGGSNVAFSINSNMLESSFHIPVINMGLHANLGLSFMLNEVEGELRNGDIVIVIPEYQQFLHPLFLDGDPKYLATVIKACPECISGLSTPKQYLNTAVGLLQITEGEIIQYVEGGAVGNAIYSRQGFNSQGDMIAHLDQPGEPDPSQHLKISGPSLVLIDPVTRRLNSFYQTANEINAKVYFMFPDFLDEDYYDREQNFIDLYNILKSKLDMPILGMPEDFLYSEEMFFDTFYHMNRTGRDLRTARIIQLLSPVFQK